MKHLLVWSAVVFVLCLPALAAAQTEPLAVPAPEGNAPEGRTGPGLPHEDRALVAAFVACAVAFITAVSILGAAYAVAHVGSAAIGAASEKPEMMGRSLVFVALGEGLAIIGLIVAIMLFTILRGLI